MNGKKLSECKFKIDQQVVSPIGKGTVSGVFRESGSWYAIVRYDKSVVPEDPIPSPHPFTVYISEDLLKPVEE